MYQLSACRILAMASGKSPISYLNELAAKRGIPQPKYEEEKVGGSDHAPDFVTKVTFDGN